ncbi:chitin-binding protein [Micromonospora pattaloongensis]|uniref:Chitin-binding protein n=1 Tax=Micromonospora pattaloongensis TaxID=405436 RepID=A0A1H3RW69_9ACTN|nr:lytic polysaccharide monooxygenase [Micromonospora pattaloongensis]SDZ29973.1 chitin-binding protein [Micromonospora pattaloongensis]
MRRSIAYPLAAVGAMLSTLAVAPTPAQAHGYVSFPPSRQALCAQGKVANCGPIQFEPQSVEGPKGLKSCNAGLAPFSVLNDDSRAWPATSVGTSVTFSWVLTARHRTTTWQYFIGDRMVAQFDDGNTIPQATVTHRVDLSGFSGRQKLLAVWNIGDTPMAFYSCVDLQIGGGAAPAPQQPAPAPTSRPSTPPPAAPAPAPTTAAPARPGGTAWAPRQNYRVDDVVAYEGRSYRCRQAHMSLESWEPTVTPALWLAL